MVTKYFIPLIGNNQQKEQFLKDFEAKIERIRKKEDNKDDELSMPADFYEEDMSDEEENPN